MSHDVKYIGLDVHKEAIVIAVLNGTGRLVMETILGPLDLSTVERAWLVSQHFGGKPSAQWVNTWSGVRSEGNMTGSNVLSPRLT
jgi:hypothetical protein